MSGPRALTRLLWRPDVLMLLLPLAWAVLMPLALLEDVAPIRELWSRDPGPAAWQARWRMLVWVMPVLGFTAATVRLELQYATLGWMLPGIRRGLLAGTLLIAVPPAAALAMLVARGGSVAVAATAFAWALFWFAIPGLFMDGALPRLLRWAARLGLIAAAFGTAHFARVAEAWPLAGAAMALLGFGAMLHVQQSARYARRRLFRWSIFATSLDAVRYRDGRAGSGRQWDEPLATVDLRPWLRAAAYESRVRLPVVHLRVAAVAVLMAHLLNLPMMMIIGAASGFAVAGMQLGAGLLYPLGRARRADVAFAGAVLDAATFSVCAAVLAAGLQWLSLPALPWYQDSNPGYSWPVMLGIVFALAPVPQWGVVRRSAAGERLETSLTMSYVWPFIAYAVIAAAAAAAIVRSGLSADPLATAVAIAALAGAVYLGFWLTLRRLFARMDLLRVGG
ncbi:hypothetical protein BH23GEM9_BH23GEM9_05110 [soil metagenome]